MRQQCPDKVQMELLMLKEKSMLAAKLMAMNKKGGTHSS